MSSELKKVSVDLKFIGSIVIFLVFGILVLLFWPRSHDQTLDQKRALARAEKLNLLNKDNHEKLSKYAWGNKGKGIVQLPIDRAMTLVANELAAKPVKASAVKVENPYPYGLQPVAAPAVPPATAAPASGAPAAVPAPAAPGAPAAVTQPVAVPASSAAVSAPVAAPSSAAPGAPATAPVAVPSGTWNPPATIPTPAK